MNPSSSEHDVIILGAGPSGLGAGLTLGPRALVLEQAERAGGLSGTLELEGAVFDIGGHSFHTPHPEVRRLVEEVVDLYDQPRDARCFSHERMLRYPFQKHFRDVGNQAVIRECAEGLAAAPAQPAAKNFQEFLEQRFGRGIAHHFMLPYNRKLWGQDLSRLAADWVSERVAAPEGVDEVFEEHGGKRKPLQPGTRVAYPARGGFGAIMTALAERLHDVRYGQRAISIDPKHRTVRTSAGALYHFRTLISTLPLPRLLATCQGVPDELSRAAAALECLSLQVVLLVIDHPVDSEIQRIYCADDTVPAHKVALNHNSSPYLRGLPRHGVMAEVSCANGTRADGELVSWTLRGLKKMGIIRDAGEVIATRVLKVEHAYPVPTLGRDALVARLRDWLGERGIHTVGRFGEWAYINSDEALFRGLRLGKSL